MGRKLMLSSALGLTLVGAGIAAVDSSITVSNYGDGYLEDQMKTYFDQFMATYPDIKIVQNSATSNTKLKTRVVWINAYETGDLTTPFGCFKPSGFGHDKSIHVFDKYSDVKTTGFALS